MFVIVAYDVNEKRVAKVLKVGRKYLNWVQNSLLEGELTKAKYERLKAELREIIDEKEDSIVFYTLRTPQYMRRETIGLNKGGQELIL